MKPRLTVDNTIIIYQNKKLEKFQIKIKKKCAVKNK